MPWLIQLGLKHFQNLQNHPDDLKELATTENWFLSAHLTEHHHIVDAFSHSLGVFPEISTFYRNPKERLNSALNHCWQSYGRSHDFISQQINNKNMLLDNSQYRQICSVKLADLRDNMRPVVDNIYNLSNLSQGLYISCLLSRRNLPNVLMRKNIHTTPDEYKLPPDMLNSYVHCCEDNGFQDYEESSVLLSMIMDPVTTLATKLKIREINPITVFVDVNRSKYSWQIFNIRGVVLPTELALDSLFMEELLVLLAHKMHLLYAIY